MRFIKIECIGKALAEDIQAELNQIICKNIITGTAVVALENMQNKSSLSSIIKRHGAYVVNPSEQDVKLLLN